ncbi:GerAB/ArcD/ProY family transporter [Paenibacillus soyae]|uniref:Spore germination protein n=1 Tax=Paenibacillus soyae TaxID=2969249 RepID=A0A9X2SBI0_9BACL|nr:spore germination protein [Paenibacillus soyae]MCR2805673.1 spore germination protein [Paenibacillus soyae]
MEKISHYQLASGIILFQIGSSSLFLLASNAKQDAWIATSIAMIAGFCLLLFVTLPIQKMEPGKNLVQILQTYMGKYAGAIIAAAYILYFSYKSIRNVREFGDLMIVYLLPNTPLSVILLILVFLSGYAVYQGLEVFFRITEFLLPIVVFIYAALILTLLSSGIVHFERLEPLLEHGIKPVFDAAIPEVISFPFGEMVVLLMFWSHYNNKPNMSRVTLASYLFSGVFIIFTNMIILASLSATSFLIAIPFMMGTSFIQIAGIIERMDPFVAILLFTGVFIKQTTYFLAAVLACSELFKMKRRKALIPIGALIFIGCLLFRSHMEQVWTGFKYNVVFHFPIFQIWIPAALVLVMLLKKYFKRARI